MQLAAPANARRFMRHVAALLWLDWSGLVCTTARKYTPHSSRCAGLFDSQDHQGLVEQLIADLAKGHGTVQITDALPFQVAE